ncbi:MAG: hypothetical protein ACTHMD_09540 [Flavisolibacter sp.]
MSTLPKATLILGYKEFFNQHPPSDRLANLAGICKRNLITEFAGLNYRLKPNNSRYYDTTLKTQVEELKYFCGIDPVLHKHYAVIADKFTSNNKEYPLIFTRQTCMFALEEIIQSDMPVIEDFHMAKVEVWNSIFKYILAVNSEITAIAEGNDEVVNFETLNPKMLPLNEMALDTDPFSIPYRAYSLFEYLSDHEEIKQHFKDYINSTYNFTPEKYIYEVLRMYLANKHENPTLDFAYNITSPKDQVFFEILSQRFTSTAVHKLLSIRKYPFYMSGEGSFLLTDNMLLLDKLYSQFINDFWFDYLKNTDDWNIKKYKSAIGYFFESYVRDVIDYAFQDAKYYTVRQFQELNVFYKGDQIEIADLYIRYNSKVLIGQVKSTTLYDTEKYSGNLEHFYKNKREDFFASFGVNQLVQSIKLLNETIRNVDNKFPFNKVVKVFPVIIFNEKALQTPLMAQVFQKRFLELLGDFQNNKIHVYPLSLVHISDLETLQDLLHKKSGEIWELLKYHCRFPKFMPPFYNTIHRKGIKPGHQRTMALYEKLIPKFSGEQNNS